MAAILTANHPDVQGQILATEHSLSVTLQDIAVRSAQLAAMYAAGDAPSPADLRQLVDSAQGLRDDLVALETLTHLQSQLAQTDRSARNAPLPAMTYGEYLDMSPEQRLDYYDAFHW